MKCAALRAWDVWSRWKVAAAVAPGALLALPCDVAAAQADTATAASAGHPFGWLSLLPPLVAIFLAIATGRIVVSLLLGVFVGALISAGGDPLIAVAAAMETHLWPALADPDHLRVFAFTLLMGAMVGVMHRSGGMHGLVDRLLRWVTSRRRAHLTTWILGLVIFFDDYANTLLLGGTLRPMTDRLRISREKLAYLVDSTAAPVAGLALVSTWVAGEVGYIQAGLDQVGSAADHLDAFSMLVATLPYRFYVLWALVFVALVGWMGRDFGPMLSAERRALARRKVTANGDEAEDDELQGPDADQPRRWHLAVVPVVVLVTMIGWLLYLTGAQGLESAKGQGFSELLAESEKPVDVWIALLDKSDSYLALVYGSLTSLLVVAGLAVSERILSITEVRRSAWAGAQAMMPALLVLLLAWSLSDTTGSENLQTAEYLGGLIGPWLDVALMPTVVFLLAAGVAFSTGTSWGTMGILMPLAIEVTAGMLETAGHELAAGDPIFAGTVGGVLAGAIFGDHCSPISDTTVLSSRASGCDHVAHVRTQLPYALLVAAVSVVCGTLPVAYGWPVGWSLVLGTVALVVLLRVLGKRAGSEETGPV